MYKRVIPALIVTAALAAGVAACGSDSGSGSPDGGSTLPPVSDGFTHPTGADDVVIEYAEVGGFVPIEVAFQQTPNVLVSGDGQLFTPGMVTAIFPGPLVFPMQVQAISEAGIQQLLTAADEAGLLADVTYDSPTQIADASTARVVINANGDTYVHEAYALGLELPGEETSPERQALATFIEELLSLSAVDAGELGESAIFEADEFGIQATAIDDLGAYEADGIEPTVVEWPAEVSVRLADTSACTVVPAGEVGELLTAANSLTFFDDAGVTYQVLAKQILPGTDC